MKINENKVIFTEVRFDDLKPGDTFAIDRGLGGYTYAIKARTELVEGFAINLEDGRAIFPQCCDLVIPVDIIGDVKWPDKFFKRK